MGVAFFGFSRINTKNHLFSIQNMYKRGASSLVHLLKTYKEKEKSKV